MTGRTAKSTLAALAMLAVVFSGCESSDDSSGAYWQTKQKGAATAQSQDSSVGEDGGAGQQESATGVDGEVGGADEVAFGGLSWSFGGVNGARAAKTAAAISRLSISNNILSYSWAAGGCETLGASSSTDHTKTIACLFVQRADGSWVGGKFDWISTSRRSRPLTNVLEGYSGWSLANVPNPCACAFVIVSSNGRKRTNVITGTWAR